MASASRSTIAHSPALAWRDVLAVEPVAEELGTEDRTARWGYELENDNGKGRINFCHDQGIIGRQCLRLMPNPYPGAYAAAIFAIARDAGWNFSGKKIRPLLDQRPDPNIPGYQNAGPVVRLLGRTGANRTQARQRRESPQLLSLQRSALALDARDHPTHR